MAIDHQQPAGSGFNARPDGAEVIRELDLSGKTAIVTGAYRGLGLETVRALATDSLPVVASPHRPRGG